MKSGSLDRQGALPGCVLGNGNTYHVSDAARLLGGVFDMLLSQAPEGRGGA